MKRSPPESLPHPPHHSQRPGHQRDYDEGRHHALPLGNVVDLFGSSGTHLAGQLATCPVFWIVVQEGVRHCHERTDLVLFSVGGRGRRFNYEEVASGSASIPNWSGHAY